MDKLETDDFETILRGIKKGDDSFLKYLYEENRQRFLKWVSQHYRCSDSEARDIYQQAFSILYFNIKDGKITSLSSSVRTYLFGIAKNLLKKLNKTTSQNVSLEKLQNVSLDDLDSFQLTVQNEQNSMVKKLLDQIGDPCKSILILFYFRRFSMESIAERMGYKNEQVMKKKKCLCLKQLREMLNNSNKNQLLS